MAFESRASHSNGLRLVLLLDACEAADLAPIPVSRLHAFAFLANILAPVWSEHSFDGKILKRSGGPFYPELQRDLDRLVGLGIATVHDVGHVKERGRWRLEICFIDAKPLAKNSTICCGAGSTSLSRARFSVAQLPAQKA
jgi:hypothetical protein